MFDDQSGYQERFEWGEAGVLRLAPISDIVVIVDVLSFSTAVEIARSRGALVYPYRWRDERAASFAQSVDAVLASPGRMSTDESGYSLSPASLREIPAGTRLVLPSPNGATLSVHAAEHGSIVLAGCLRNASAIARACRTIGGSVAVIAAGERWVDAGELTGSLRPAIEDLVGAGAILSALNPTNPSPEARVAMAAFAEAIQFGPMFLRECSSGRELIERGFAEDVDLAAAIDSSETVPLLETGGFRTWTAGP